MNQKTVLVCLGVIAALALSGCSSGASGGNSAAGGQASPQQGSSQRGGRGGQAAADPQLQQLMQDQQKDQQQIEQLVGQIHTDAGLPEPQQTQTPPQGGQRQGNGGNGGQGQGQQAQGQGQGQANEQDMQAAKDLLTQEHQAATDLVAKLTAFDAAVKQAAGNQKALKDAQTQFAPIEAALPLRNRGFFQGNRGQNGNGGFAPRNLTQGLQTRIDDYKAAATKLDAATAQLKADLGK